MNLSEYIALIGDKAAAKLFGVSERVAQSYRNGERRPRPERAQQIIDATGGKVDWAGIYSQSIHPPKRAEAEPTLEQRAG